MHVGLQSKFVSKHIGPLQAYPEYFIGNQISEFTQNLKGMGQANKCHFD